MKLDINQIQLMNTLDDVAHVGAKDCFVTERSIIYLVPEDQMSQAIGKKGANVEKLSKKLGKKVEFFEYMKEPEKFLEKAFFKAKIDKIEIKNTKEKKIAVVNADNTNKRLILQNLGRLKKIKELCQRNYNIEEVRIR